MRMPKNHKIIRTMAVAEDKVVMVLKSKCRHYTALLFQVQEQENGDHVMVMTDKKTRCGMKKCAGTMF